jgi:membrane protein DedA with SNARE-associated domain
VTRWFTRCGDVLILIARLTPGTRAVVFITAGIHAVRLSTFLRYEVLGAALWVPAMLAAGHAAGGHLGGIGEVMDLLHRGAAWTVAVAGVLLVVWLYWGREESKL